MERRKVLLGSGALFATAFAGCTSVSSNEDAESGYHSTTTSRDHTSDREKNTDGAEKTESDHEKEEKTEHEEESKTDQQGEIPGFDRHEFEIDSDVIELKKLAYRNQKLDIRVMVRTTDADVLADELRALAPAFKRAIRDADVDAEEFFAQVQQIKFTVYNRHKTRVFAVFLDLRWLRKLFNEEMTDEEFANRICAYMDDA